MLVSAAQTHKNDGRLRASERKREIDRKRKREVERGRERKRDCYLAKSDITAWLGLNFLTARSFRAKLCNFLRRARLSLGDSILDQQNDRNAKRLRTANSLKQNAGFPTKKYDVDACQRLPGQRLPLRFFLARLSLSLSLPLHSFL